MKRHLNLLPWKLRRAMLLRVRLRQWGTAWAVLVIIALSLCTKNWHGLSMARHELEIWQRRAAGIQKVSEQNDSLRRQIAALHERRLKYGHLNSEQIGFQLLATVSQNSALTTGKHQIQKFMFKHSRVSEAPKIPATPPTAAAKAEKARPKMRDVRTLSLSGVANNNLTIAQFVSSLRDSGAFQTVDLKSSQGSKAGSPGSQVYQVECAF